MLLLLLVKYEWLILSEPSRAEVFNMHLAVVTPLPIRNNTYTLLHQPIQVKNQ